MVRVVDTSGFKELEYPEQLSGSWFYYVLFENHPNPDISGISCIYFNDKYPSGSVCMGRHLLNDYPDAYCVLGKFDDEGNMATGRMFVAPPLRQQGVASAGVAYGVRMIGYLFNKEVVHSYGSEIGNKTYAAAAEIGKLSFDGAEIEEGFHMKKEYFDQPVHPYIFFGRRFST
jgi:hypothetical protein